MALIYQKFLSWSIWPCLEAFFFYSLLVVLQLNSSMFHAFAKTDMIKVVFIVWCLMSCMCLLKKGSFSKCDLYNSSHLFFPLHEHIRQLSQTRQVTWVFFFPLFARTVFEMSSVVAEKLQLSYTNTLCWSFSPNINLTRIVSLVIGNSLYMHIITSLKTWGLQ